MNPSYLTDAQLYSEIAKVRETIAGLEADTSLSYGEREDALADEQHVLNNLLDELDFRKR